MVSAAADGVDPPARSAITMLGRTIGNYVITGELARGGMGIVYHARHVTLPRDAVVKCIRPLAVSDEAQNQLRARFRREAHIQSQLDHMNGRSKRPASRRSGKHWIRCSLAKLGPPRCLSHNLPPSGVCKTKPTLLARSVSARCIICYSG